MTNGRLRALTVFVCVAACALSAGCATDPVVDGPETLSQSNAPLYLQDAYAIAHGMAKSYATSANANPAVVDQLKLLDVRAFEAVVTLSREPLAPGQRAVTANAVAALTNFAAAQTYSTQ